MLDSTIVFDLIGQIYDAAVAPDLWRLFLEALAAAVGGGAAQMALSLPREGQLGVASANWEGEVATREYAEYFYAHDPWMQRAHEIRSGLGAPVDWAALEPPEHTRRTVFWNDFLRRHGIGYEAPIGVVLRREGSRSTGACSVHPLKDQKPYGPDESQLMATLGPHLLRAVRIHELLSEHQTTRSAEAEALDRMPFGVLLVDARGRIVQANSFARRLLSDGDGLRADGTRMAGGTPAITHALSRLIGEAIEAGSDPAARMGGAISLPRPIPRRALEALVVPTRLGPSSWTTDRGLAAVFVSDPDERAEPPADLLRRLYGLTPAEAGVAARLGAGATIDEVAEGMRLTRNTARFYLKRVFAKTGTRRQAELVRLLTTGVVRVGAEDEAADER